MFSGVHRHDGVRICAVVAHVCAAGVRISMRANVVQAREKKAVHESAVCETVGQCVSRMFPARIGHLDRHGEVANSLVKPRPLCKNFNPIDECFTLELQPEGDAIVEAG